MSRRTLTVLHWACLPVLIGACALPAAGLDEAALKEEINQARNSLAVRRLKVSEEERTRVAEQIGRSNFVARAWKPAVEQRDFPALKELLGLIAGQLGSFRLDRKPLVFEAVERGDRELVEFLISHGADPNAAGWRIGGGAIRPPLHLALQRGDLETARILLEGGADPNAPDSAGLRPLHLNVNPGLAYGSMDAGLRTNWTEVRDRRAELNVAGARLLLAHGADPLASGTNALALTPLEMTVQRQNAEVLDLLLTNAPVTGRTPTGDTPLHLAAYCGRLDAARTLLARGADVRAVNSLGLTPLQMTASLRPPRPVAVNDTVAAWQLIRLAQELAALLRAPWRFEALPKLPFSRVDFWESAARNRSAMADLLLSRGGAELDLFSLAGLGRREALARRLAWPFSRRVHARDPLGRTLLHWAVLNADPELTALLLQRGADSDAVIEPSPAARAALAAWSARQQFCQPVEDSLRLSLAGRTALHLAAARGDWALVSALLAAKARPYPADSTGRLPIELALAGGHTLAAAELLSETLRWHGHTAYPSRLFHLAVGRGANWIVAELARRGTPLEPLDPRGLTALHVAASGTDFRMLELLLEAGADINLRDKDGNTILHQLAVRQMEWTAPRLPGTGDESPMVTLSSWLLERGADPNATNHFGQTPLHRLSERPAYESSRTPGPSRFVTELLDHGARLESVDGAGWTPLHRAADRRNTAILEVLLARDARVDARMPDGRTALHLVATNVFDLTNSLRVLLQARADVNVADHEGRTPLHVLLSARSGGTQLGAGVLAVLQAGADRNAADRQGRTPVHAAAAMPAWAFYHGVRGAPAELLLAPPADLNARDAEGNTPLLVAVREGNRFFLQAARDLGLDLTQTNHHGQTVFHLLAQQTGGIEVRQELEHLTWPREAMNRRDRDGNTPFHLALRREDTELVRKCIAAGADPNLADAEGRIPLMRLASGVWNFSKRDLLETVVAGGADGTVRDAEGNTPLHHLARARLILGGGQELASARLLTPALVNATNGAGDTPLHLALRSGDWNLVVRMAGAGARFDLPDSTGTSCFELLATRFENYSISSLGLPDMETGFFTAIRIGRTEEVEAWLKRAPRLASAVSQTGDSAVQTAARHGHFALAERLLTAGAPMDPITAALLGRAETFAGLVQKGQQPPPERMEGALLAAVSNGQPEAVRLLVEAGAQPHAVGPAGHSVLHLARHRVPELVPLLEQHGASENLWDAIAQTNTAAVTRWLAADPEAVRRRAPDGRLPLHTAVYTGSPAIIRTLLAAGADREAEAEDFRRQSPLSLAAGTSNVEAAAELLAAGARIEATDISGFTPLHRAVMAGQLEMARLLLDRGANVNAQMLGTTRTRATTPYQRPSGNAPLHFAAIKGDPDLAALLLERGALINATNNHGHTPLALVKQKVMGFGSMGVSPATYPALRDGQIRDRMIEFLERRGAR